MKLSPSKKVSKKTIPTIKEYQKNHYATDVFKATAFSLGLALTPLVITGCNSDTLANNQVKTSTAKKVAPKTVTEKKIEKTEKTLGDTVPCDSGKKEEKTDGEIEKPVQLGGVPRVKNDDVKEDIKKDDKKDTDIKEDVEEPVRKPLKLKGKRVMHPDFFANYNDIA
jgi:hypothetical protein